MATKTQFLATLRRPAANALGYLQDSGPGWNLIHRNAISRYRTDRPELSNLQTNVLDELRQDGVVATSLGDLLPSENQAAMVGELSALMTNDAEVGETKKFLHYAWGVNPQIELNNPFVRIAINPGILAIVNSYVGMFAKLIRVELAQTDVLAPGQTATGSQRWHRDPGIRHMVKLFVYLTDVDESSGPFTYLLQSARAGRRASLFPQPGFGRHGFYPPAGAVEAATSDVEIKRFLGPAGTAIICDTVGLHYGGYSLEKPRVMLTATYSTRLETYGRANRLRPADDERVLELTPSSQYANN